MANRQKVNFSVDEKNITLREFADSQLALAEIKVVRSGMNTHKLPVDLEALKKGADTLYNKFLVAGFNGYDFKGHVENEMIIGHFPREFPIEFEETAEGTFLKATAIISNYYAPWATEALKSVHNGKAAVSIEAITTTEIREDGLEWIIDIAFFGVTVLGKKINPSSSGSELVVTRFSESEFVENTTQLWSNYKNKTDFWTQSQELITNLTKKDAIITLAEKEDNTNMEDNLEVKFDIPTDTKVEDNLIKPIDEEDKDETVMLEAEAEVKMEETTTETETETKTETETEDNAVEEEKEVEMACGETVGMEMCNNFSATEFEELKVKFAQLSEEYNKLKEFEKVVMEERALKLAEENKQKIEFACNEVSEDMPSERVEEWKAKVVEFANVDAWTNALKSDAYNYAKVKIKEVIEPKTHNRMATPSANNFKPSGKKSLWS